jgi:tetratricopeptide (TPR) repeat protein
MKRFALCCLPFLFLMLHLSCQQSQTHQNNREVQTPPAGDLSPEAAALRQMTSALEKDAENDSLLNERALAYLKQGKMNEALRDINEALRLKPDEAEYLITLSDIYFGLNQSPKTRQTLLKVLELYPENTNAMLKLAEMNLYFRDYEGVESYARRAIATDPTYAQAYFILGFAKKETGDTSAAIRLFQQTIDRDPVHYEAFMQAGILLAARKDKLAEAYYKGAIALDAERLEAYYNLGLYYQENEFYNEAMKMYNDLIALRPDFKLAYYNLGYIHLVNLEVYNEAVKFFTQALQADPNYVEAVYNRGYAYELMGDVLNARQDYQRALQLRPNYGLAISGLNRLDQMDRDAKDAGLE